MKTFPAFFRSFYSYFVAFMLIIFAASCGKNITEPQPLSAGDIISSKSMRVYSTDEIAGLLNNYQIPDSFDISFSVEAISITYQTADARGNNIQASGALLMPQNTDNLPVLSIQHGTETKRERVASVNPLNSVEGVSGLLTASMGYVTCIPDYPGFGVSSAVHPYMHAKSLTKSVTDFLAVVRGYCKNHNISLNNQLFLTGYSEGGYVTLSVQKEIEENSAQEFSLTAVAPMAGPYDLLATSDRLLQQANYQWPVYVAFLFYAYDKLYGWNRLHEIFNEPYGSMIPSLFNGSKTFAEINSQLPTDVTSLVKPAFIYDYFSGNEEAIRNALRENTLLSWKPLAPVHFFHGDSDNVSLYQNSLTAVDSLTANGGTEVLLTTIPGGTHATASLPSLLGAIVWFNSKRSNSPLMAMDINGKNYD